MKYVFAPTNIGICSDGSINEEFVNFYLERSGKNIDLTYIGNVSIGQKYTSNEKTPLFLEEDIELWKKLTGGITSNGSFPGVQLGCRYYNKPALRNNYLSSIDYIYEVSNFILNMSTDEISNIIEEFIDSVSFADKVGFKWIQIHAAHGYFLSILCSESLNNRTDKYKQADIVFIKEIIEGIKRISLNLKIDIRISVIEGLKSKNEELASKKRLISKINNLDVDMISLSNGLYDFDKKYIYPEKDLGFFPHLNDMLSVTSGIEEKNVNLSGNINNYEYIKKLNLPDNYSLSLCRPLIANPYFLCNFNYMNCTFCGSCHYYSKSNEFTCPIYLRNFSKNVV